MSEYLAESYDKALRENDTLRAERDEAVRKYEERVRQHEEYIAFADEEITGLIEKKRMVLVSLDEAVALLREAAPHVGRGPVTKELRRRIDDFLAPDSASHRENERG